MNHLTIWGERQNKPTLVVRDLEAYAPADVVYTSLLRRGVFKWLAVRRDLIKLKNFWRNIVRGSIEIQRVAKANGDWAEVHYQRGYRAAMEACRAEVRALCHSQRWRAPDFDRNANRWLDARTEV